MNRVLEHTKLIHHVARKWIASFEKAGSVVSYDDLVQEGFIACINAHRMFDETRGLAFSTYFVTCANHHYAGMLKRVGRPVSSLDEAIVDDLPLIDLIEDAGENPEAEVMTAASVQADINSLPALAKSMLGVLIDPPEFVRSEFLAMDSKRKVAKQLGIDERYPSELNLSFVATLFASAGIGARDINMAKDSIRELEATYEV